VREDHRRAGELRRQVHGRKQEVADDQIERGFVQQGVQPAPECNWLPTPDQSFLVQINVGVVSFPSRFLVGGSST